jgi:hypothetical protein
MMIKIVLFFGLILAGIYTQDKILNKCAIKQLGNNPPTQKEECWQDSPAANVLCCFVKVTNVETPFNYCAPLDVGVEWKEIADSVIDLYPPASVEVECSASHLSNRVIFILLLSLILF